MTERPSETNPETEAPYPNPVYAWFAVIMLTVAYALSLLDRWVLTLLVAPVKAALNLSDTAIGLLMGPIFAAVYVLSGLPFGWAVDRMNRRNLVGSAIGFWSIMTVASGFAKNFFQLATCRFGIGFGEAALSPAATSLIADMFPRRKVNAAVGVFNLGIYTGMGLSYLIGGALLAWATVHHTTFLGGTMDPWQIVFVLVGLPGFLVAGALMIAVREPKRRGVGAKNSGSMKECFSHIRRHRTALVPLAVGMGTVGLFGYGFTWLPTMFTRVWGWEPERFSMYYGIILLTAGPLGTVLGGIIANRLYDRGLKDAPFRVLSVSLPCLVLVGGTAALWPNPYITIAALTISAFFSSMSTSAGVASVIFATPSQYRGRVLALYTMTNAMIGTLIGPTGVGLLNDMVFGEGEGIRWSVAVIMLGVGGPLTLYLLTGRKGYSRAVTELEAA